MGKIIPIERARENEITKRAKEKDTRRFPRDEARRWRRPPIHHGRERAFLFQRKAPVFHLRYGRYQPFRLLDPLRLSLDSHIERIFWNVLQDNDLARSQELTLCRQRLKAACQDIPHQIRESRPSSIGLFSFISSLLKFSNAARSDSRLSNRLAELMEKNSKQHRTFFANSLEKIKALLWSYVEHSKHTGRIAEKELTESIIAERKARKSREERIERKRLEKKQKEERAQKKQLRRLKAKILSMLVSQRIKIKELIRKANSSMTLLKDIENALKILLGDKKDAVLQIISTERTVPINARTIIETAKLLEEIRPIIMSAVSTGDAEKIAHLIMERIPSSSNSSQNLNSLVISHLIRELDPHAAILLHLSVYNAVVNAVNAEPSAILSTKAFIAEAIKQIMSEDNDFAIPILFVNKNYYAADQETTFVNPTRMNFGESSLQDKPSETDKHPFAIETPAKADTASGLSAKISAAEELLLSENPSKAKKHLKDILKAAATAEAKISFDQLTLGYFYAGILFDKNFLNKQSNLSIEISRGREHYTSVRSLIRIIEILEGQNQTAIERGQQMPAAISIAAETLLYGLIMRKLKARRSKALKIISALKNNEEAWDQLLSAIEVRDFEKVSIFINRLTAEARKLKWISLERAVENIWHPYYFRRIAA